MKNTARHQYLKVNEVELDINNPRISLVIETYGENPQAEALSNALCDGSSSFNSLRDAIQTNNGLINPIIVNEKPDGKLTVIEGNTRLLIYKEFLNDETPGNWDVIPATVYLNLDNEEIDAIRLQAHLIGTREWDAYSKGKYLAYLKKVEYMPDEKLVQYCGGRKAEVARRINAFEDMEKYYRPHCESDDEFDPHNYSLFDEIQKSKRKDALKICGFDMNDFGKWVYENKFDGRQNHVRDIDKILKNEAARESFLKYNSSRAIKLVDKTDIVKSLLDASFTQLCEAIEYKIDSMELPTLERIQNNTDDREKITSAAAELNLFIQKNIND